MERAREQAEELPLRLADNWAMAVFFFCIWDAVLGALVLLALRHSNAAATLPPWVQWAIVGGVVGCAAAAEVAWSVLHMRKEARTAAAGAAAAADASEPLLEEAGRAAEEV